MHMVLFDILYLYRTECTYAYMKRHICDLHAHFPCFFQKLLCKVQTGCRRCYRTFFLAVDCLIPVLVLAVILPLDIWRKGHFSQFLQPFHKDAFILEFNNSGPIFTIIFYGCPEQFLIGKGYAVSDLQSFSRTYHGFPCISLNPFNQQKFNLRSGSFFHSEKPCRQNLGVIQYQAVIRLQIL